MKTKEQEKKISNIFYFSRIIAIFAVLMAHTPFHKSDNIVLVLLVDTFACLGVALFFFSAGYYFKAVGLKKRLVKLSSLLIPWILFGSLFYLVNALSNGFQFASYLKWIIGWNSYLWFMTIYSLMILLFEGLSYFKMDKSKERICLFLFLLMIICRVSMSIFNISGAVAYLNIFNWIGFFAIGKYIETKNVVWLFNKKGCLLRAGISLLVLLILLAVDIILDSSISYFGYTAVFKQLCMILLVVSIASTLDNLPKLIINIGKNTLPIYLLHIVPLQFSCGIVPINIAVYTIIAIAIGVVLFLVLFCGVKIARKLKIEKLYERVIGFKI